MNVRLLQVADAHLGCRNFYLGERARERSEDFKLAFRDAVEYALDPGHRIDAVLIPGNLFEYHRPEESLWSFAKGLISRLLAKGIPVVMVPGHHDSLAYKNSVYRTERLPGVDVFLNATPGKPVVHDIHGQRVFFYGFAYVPGQTPSPLPPVERTQDKGFHVGVVHARRGPTEEGAVHEQTLAPDDVAAWGLDYVALGGEADYYEERCGDTTLAWTGVAESRGFGEGASTDHGHLVVEWDGHSVHLERVVHTRKTILEIALDLHGDRITDADALKEAILAHGGSDRIVRFVLKGTAEFIADLEDIQEDAADEFFHLEILDESRLVDSALLKKIESENTIRGYFVRKLGTRIEDLKARIVKKGHDAALLRELRVHEKALKIGVEQFVDEETPADSIYSLIPDSDEMVAEHGAKAAEGMVDLEEKVRAMLEYRRRKNASLDTAAPADNGRNGTKTAPVQESEMGSKEREEGL